MDDRHSTGPPADGVDWDALARYDAGECDAAQADAVRRWLADHPEDARAFSRLRGAIGRLRATDAGQIDVAAALRTVKSRASRVSRPALALPVPRPRFAVRNLAIAAGLVIAAAGLLARYAIKHSAAPTETASRVPAVRIYRAAVGAPDSLASSGASLDSVRLSDGTRVTVAPGSAVSVAAGYGPTHRAVTLQGEAFFVVAHDALHPFTVTVDGATVRDAGTAFDVRADEPGSVRVTVTEGAVVLRAASDSAKSATVPANQVATFDGTGPIRVRPSHSTSIGTAWASGRLVFDDAPMTEVRAVLLRWYGLNVAVDSAVAGRHVTATFTDESEAHVIDVISATIGATPQWPKGSGGTGREVVLHDALGRDSAR